MKTYIFYILGVVLLLSCEVKPKQINYGDDHCHFCDMTVVDKTHASEYVTKKGKSFVFDAIECMVREIQRNNIEKDLAFILVADYANPGKLVDATKASFLISDEIKSPMGENLSAFEKLEDAKATQKQHSGKIYNWEQLKEIVK